jgi:hypothetical protein
MKMTNHFEEQYSTTQCQPEALFLIAMQGAVSLRLEVERD